MLIRDKSLENKIIKNNPQGIKISEDKYSDYHFEVGYYIGEDGYLLED